MILLIAKSLSLISCFVKAYFKDLEVTSKNVSYIPSNCYKRLRTRRADLLMLLNRHMYSSWYLRQVVVRLLAFSYPICVVRSFAMLSVDNSVP